MMKHTITIQFESVYPLSTDEWATLQRELSAQIDDNEYTYKLKSIGIVSAVPNQVEGITHGISLS